MMHTPKHILLHKSSALLLTGNTVQNLGVGKRRYAPVRWWIHCSCRALKPRELQYESK